MTRSAVPRVYIDTNIFIAAFEGNGARADHGGWLFDAMEAGTVAGYTSEMTIAEVLPYPVGREDTELVDLYSHVLREGSFIHVMPVTRAVLFTTARLRAAIPGLKLPDAIHCATALTADCDVMVTDDRRVPRDIGFGVVGLGPHTLDDIRTAIR